MLEQWSPAHHHYCMLISSASAPAVGAEFGEIGKSPASGDCGRFQTDMQYSCWHSITEYLSL